MSGEQVSTVGRLERLASAVAEAYSTEGVGIWWDGWARGDDLRKRGMEAGVLQEWSGEAAAVVPPVPAPTADAATVLAAHRVRTYTEPDPNRGDVVVGWECSEGDWRVRDLLPFGPAGSGAWFAHQADALRAAGVLR